MQRLNVFLISLIFSIFPLLANAQSGCIKVDQIAKWEVLDESKTIVYDSQGNSMAFIIFDIIYPRHYLSKSNESFRFFSSTICRSDRIQTSKGMTTVLSIEAIRK